MLKGQLIFKSVKCTKKHTTSFRRSSLNTIKRSYTPGYSQQPPSRAQKSMLGAKLSQIIWKKDDMKPIVRNIYIEHEEVAKMSKDEVMRWRKDKEIEATGFVPPNPVLNFNHMQFSDEVKNILKNKYKEPTPIQAQTWPVALSGLNLVGSAETGSGKTIAFMLPLIEHIKKQGAPVKSFIASPRVLVIAPTRELVSQIYEETRTYTDVSEIRISYAYGGSDNRRSQISSLRKNPQVVVGSPGRIIDFVESQQLDISHVSALVLDEADRMFDMGFEDQLRMILSQVRPDRQVLMFSATWPKKLQVLAREYFPDFVNVNIGPTDLSANKNVHQKFMFIEYGQKIDSLIDILKKDEDGKYLIFASMKTTVSQLAQELRGQGIHALELHGDKQQSARERTLLEFKRGTGKVLIATDVASRGLDIKNIGYVVNFDLPKNIEDYIHRIGRTARAGNKGESISFFTRNDIPLVKDLVEVLESSNQVVPDEFKKIIQVQKQEQMSKMNNNNRRNAGFSNLDRPRTQYGRRDNYGNNNYGNNNYGNRNNYGNNNYENNNYGNRNNNRRYDVNGGGNFNQRRNNQFGERNNESGFNRRRIVTEYDNDEFEERSQRNNSFGRRNNDFESEDFPQRGNGRIADMFENNTRNQEKRTENKSRLNSLLNKLGNNDQSKKKSRNDDLIVTDELEDD